jgi:hypothetical protein
MKFIAIFDMQEHDGDGPDEAGPEMLAELANGVAEYIVIHDKNGDEMVPENIQVGVLVEAPFW